jgi:hypothetical protein
MKIAHLVNPVMVDASSDLFVAQPITFESMHAARRHSAEYVDVELLAVGYQEDQPLMPEGFEILPPLTRSVLDVQSFPTQRKLPLLKDILSSLYENSEAEYLIYTNVDIGLQPDFYLAVLEFINQGYDAFVINRRTISNRYRSIDDLPQMWAESGEAHRGWDCFIFHREYYPSFELGNVCIGASRVGLALLANLEAVADHFHEFKDEYLTFHLGDDRSWRDASFQAYTDHNSSELDNVLERLEERYGHFPRSTTPGAYLFKRRNFGWLYETWSNRIYIPVGWSRRLNNLFGRMSGVGK